MFDTVKSSSFGHAPPPPRIIDGIAIFGPHNYGEEEPWAWVKALDELSRSRRQGDVFVNFIEGEILFPPSYRWARGQHKVAPVGVPQLASSSSKYGSMLSRSQISSYSRVSESGSQVEEQEVHDDDASFAAAEMEGDLLAGDFTDIDRLWSAYTTSVGTYVVHAEGRR